MRVAGQPDPGLRPNIVHRTRTNVQVEHGPNTNKRSPNIYPNTNKLMSEHEHPNTNTEQTSLIALLERL